MPWLQRSYAPVNIRFKRVCGASILAASDCAQMGTPPLRKVRRSSSVPFCPLCTPISLSRPDVHAAPRLAIVPTPARAHTPRRERRPVLPRRRGRLGHRSHRENQARAPGESQRREPDQRQEQSQFIPRERSQRSYGREPFVSASRWPPHKPHPNSRSTRS